MELKYRKLIKNKAFPRYKNGDETNPNSGGIFPWQSVISLGLQNLGGLVTSLNPGITSNQLMANAGTHTVNSGGIDYVAQNTVDNQALEDYDNKILGDVASGNILSGLGSILGGRSKVKKAIDQANIKATNRNDFNRSLARTTGMQEDYYSQYGNTRDQQLYHAHNGKQSVATATGDRTDVKHDSYVGEGEYIWDGIHVPFYINRGPNDTRKAHLTDRDVVFTANPEIPAPEGFKTIADAVPYFASQGRLRELEAFQGMAKKYKNMKTDKHGFLMAGNGEESMDFSKLQHVPGVDIIVNASPNFRQPRTFYPKTTPTKQNGGGGDNPYIEPISDWQTIIPRGLGMLGAVGGYIKASREPVSYRNNYTPNMMGNRALRTMAGIRTNPYYDMTAANSAYKNALYGLVNSGGLSGAQKHLASIQLAANAQKQNADISNRAQQQNNQYTAALGNMEYQLGSENAKNWMNAANLADDLYYRGNANKRRILRTYETDLSNNLQALFQGVRDSRTLNNMLALYQQQIKNDAA